MMILKVHTVYNKVILHCPLPPLPIKKPMPTTTTLNGLESEVPSPSSSSGSGSFTGFDLALVFAVLAVAVFLRVGDLEAAEITT